MKLAKAFAIVVSAGLLSVATFGSPRDLYAQDGSETDQGAWSAPDAGSADQSSPDTKKTHPLNIKGCWSGSVTDTGDGTGTAMFVFHQNGNHKKIIIGTTFMFQWADSAMARGPLKGSVTATGFTVKGNAGITCQITGNATGNATALMGAFTFTGDCASIFQDVTFSITPGCN